MNDRYIDGGASLIQLYGWLRETGEIDRLIDLVIEKVRDSRQTEKAKDSEPPLRAENERLRALASFGALLLPKWWDDGNPGDIDGGDAQEAAEACGLWHEVERHADGVECEWCGNEGPCGELTEAGLAVIAAPEVSR